MSFEEARVITIVYLAVFLPFLIYFKTNQIYLSGFQHFI